MTRCPHPLLRYPLAFLFVVAAWFLLVPALDMPVQELQGNVLLSLRATAALTALAACYYLCYLPRLYVNRTDMYAILFLGWVTAGRFLWPGLASAVRYDELLQAAMLYAALRIIFTAERRTMTLLLMLLCVLGIYEAWVGIRQIYGFAQSNHGLFRITGTLFNPGPYAGFIAPVFVCAAACVARYRFAERALRTWGSLRRLRAGVLLWGVAPYLLGWVAALMTVVVLPASMSRAVVSLKTSTALLVAAAVGCGALAFRVWNVRGRFRYVYRAHPLRVGVLSGLAVLLLAGIGAGAYHIKRPSAEGRLLMWKIDTRIMLRHPLCGGGIGNFAGAFGEEQARYFASEERPKAETQVAGCPEAGFNEFLQTGAETGAVGLVLLLLITGSAIVSQLRRGAPFGYGLLAAAVFACFSYPWGVLPLRLLFVVLLAGTCSKRVVPIPGRGHVVVLLALAGCLVCWTGLYSRYARRVEARRQWSEIRIWPNSGRYDYLVEDGPRYHDALQGDFRFLYDYGYALHKTGSYRQSNEILREGMRISSDPMFWNIAGRNYEMLGDVAAAELAYLHAHRMIPDRVYPLYLLAKLYLADGQTEKAFATACRVIAHKPKVESVQTREMQAELRKLLEMPPSGEIRE